MSMSSMITSKYTTEMLMFLNVPLDTVTDCYLTMMKRHGNRFIKNTEREDTRG